MSTPIRWSIITLSSLVGLTASFLTGIRVASHASLADTEVERLNCDLVTVMRVRSALDAHHKRDDKNLYNTLCVTLYSNAVQLLAAADALPEDHRSMKSVVRLLQQTADYKKLHPESLMFLTTDGVIPPKTV